MLGLEAVVTENQRADRSVNLLALSEPSASRPYGATRRRMLKSAPTEGQTMNRTTLTTPMSEIGDPIFEAIQFYPGQLIELK
jgi:hypothetical protein